jgi:hypothetical protein
MELYLHTPTCLDGRVLSKLSIGKLYIVLPYCDMFAGMVKFEEEWRNCHQTTKTLKLIQCLKHFSSSIQSRVGVSIDGVWMDECIHWPLIHTTRNYKH